MAKYSYLAMALGRLTSEYEAVPTTLLASLWCSDVLECLHLTAMPNAVQAVARLADAVPAMCHRQVPNKRDGFKPRLVGPPRTQR
jgi:hypothetical protein